MKKLLFLFLIFCVSQGVQAQYYLEDAWPNISFFLPVGFHAAPDSSKRIFVIEQNGRIKVFTDTGTVTGADTSTFLNVRSKLGNIGFGSEAGLLGMAFHPNFNQNGFVYINYCQNSPLRTVVSRFKVDSLNPNRVNPNSEKIIMTVTQPFANHNAGALLFGNDGYLYLTMGDGGAGGDPGNRAQNRTNLLGKILRIDVDVPENGPPYAIPADNPFVSNTTGWVKEMYALGVRNPWQMTKDAETGTMWFGDVGQGAREEIDTLRKGANYGWKVTEGFIAYSACGTCDTSDYEKPIVDYGRNLGISVTGGYVYRGNELVRLRGSYFYGDYSSRRIWTLTKSPVTGRYVNADFLTAGGNISVFGEDYNRELYVARYFANAGKFFRIRCAPPSPTLAVPSVRTVCAGDSIVMLAPNVAGAVGFKWSTGDTTQRVVLKTPGVFNLSLQVKNALGCWSNASLPIRLQVKNPILIPGISNLVGCEGDTLQFVLPTGLNYTWSAQGNVNQFSTLQSGSFWVFASDSGNCKSDTSFFQATIGPIPSAPVLSYESDTLKTSLVLGAQYEWIKDGQVVDTTLIPYLLPPSLGQYAVRIISAQGCKSEVSASVLVLSARALVIGSKNLLLFPNPVKEKLEFRIQDNLHSESLYFEILDVKGFAVLSGTRSHRTGETAWILGTQGLQSGTYTLFVKSGKKTFKKRFVKE